MPLHFINEETCPGVKTGGGNVAHILNEAEVSCLAKNLPEFIEVDLGALQVGESIHLSQIKLPKGIEFVQLAHGADPAVSSVNKPRGATTETDTDAEAPVTLVDGETAEGDAPADDAE